MVCGATESAPERHKKNGSGDLHATERCKKTTATSQAHPAPCCFLGEQTLPGGTNPPAGDQPSLGGQTLPGGTNPPWGD
eukprot:CAMPEP_0204381216 /NCGR_PEP_ID=MMETSP0469-20131031/54035_1 /ASSEMBLY_ACC=CAM_ASM_000384 /TAXON_ID=2969 /ORGANISM="Oxyrrhis marina" /LENGTH=78 /DNA_ID=CAMNT_0051373005 /DNA_START=50 /DNA_END=283 /DNA_ORIENTATION=-